VFFILSKIFDFITNPVFWVLLCLALALFLKKDRIRRKMLWAAFLMLLFFSNPWITNKVLRSWEVHPFNAARITEPYDVGIVLGGSMRYYDNESKRVVYGTSVDRLLQAIKLYHDGKIKKILLSGGSGFIMYPEWREAVFLSEVLYKCKVDSHDVLLERNSRNTRENAVATASILKGGQFGKRFLLMTSASHMRRSLACFEKAGLDAAPFPVDPLSGVQMYTLDKIIKPDSDNLSNWDALLHEWLGMVMYGIAGYI
jgi:uncharacterized SAM-binding protein YcdF (DUF218 family)